MSAFLLKSPLLPCLFLLGSLLLTICNTALIQLGRFQFKEIFQTYRPTSFFHSFLRRMFPKQEWESLYFSISLSKLIYQLAYATASFFFVLSSFPHLRKTFLTGSSSQDWATLLLFSGSIIAISVILDFLARLLASTWSRTLFQISAPLAFVYLLILFPITGLFLKLTKQLTSYLPNVDEITPTDKTRLREMIRESELRHHLDPTDQKLISSFINFKERVAKEIMVPRVDLFSLSSDTSIREASRLFAQEGYSRIPIYKDTLDQIVGVVLYKDLLKYYAFADQSLEDTLETIAKPVLYSPENKKVSQLLQEFRSKQIHMAIIVDEYGGTEGIVTIEDILEELVGEIEDEYDIGEEHSFWEVPGGGWVIDAKMTLLDIADQIGIHIPTHPEYETLGGYVYHCAGTIPSKGWRLSHDKFDLEVISSNERALKKIKILPREPA